MKPLLLLPLLVLSAAVAACGDDAAKTNDVADTSANTTAEKPADNVDPDTIRVYTSAEVCALIPEATAAATLGVELTAVAPSDLSTPQCSFEFTLSDGVRSNLTLAVQRPNEDLAGLAGKAGFDFTTSLVIFDIPYVPLAGVGDEAAVSSSDTFTIIAVLVNNQVFTLATSSGLPVANVAAFGSAVAESL